MSSSKFSTLAAILLAVFSYQRAIAQTADANANSATQNVIENSVGTTSGTAAPQGIVQQDGNQVIINQSQIGAGRRQFGDEAVSCPSTTWSVGVGSFLSPFSGGIQNSNSIAFGLSGSLGSNRTCKQAAEAKVQKFIKQAEIAEENVTQKRLQTQKTYAETVLGINGVVIQQIAACQTAGIMSTPACQFALNYKPDLDRPVSGKGFTPSGRGLDSSYSEIGTATTPKEAVTTTPEKPPQGKSTEQELQPQTTSSNPLPSDEGRSPAQSDPSNPQKVQSSENGNDPPQQSQGGSSLLEKAVDAMDNEGNEKSGGASSPMRSLSPEEAAEQYGSETAPASVPFDIDEFLEQQKAPKGGGLPRLRVLD